MILFVDEHNNPLHEVPLQLTARSMILFVDEDNNPLHEVPLQLTARSMILFVDEHNNPLHEVPLQLTARGCFQFEFDRQLCEFRRAMTKDCNEKATFVKDSWYI